MGPKMSTQQGLKFHFIDADDVQQSKYAPANHTTSLQSKEQRNSKSYQGPALGQEGQYTGLTEFQVPEKYKKIMQQNPLCLENLKNIATVKGSEVFDPYLFKKSLNVYYGEWKNGKPHGYGKIYNPERDFYYEGYLEEGLPSVYGIFLTNNVLYRGCIKFGRAEGKGQYKQESVKIEGQFKQNLPFRNCTQKGQNYVFQGDYENGKWRKGILSWQNETYSYEGFFKNGEFDGQGYLKTPAYEYEGTFKQGKKHGNGNILWTTGDVYKGQFFHDEITGKGQIILENNLVYKGDFSHGCSNGEGCILDNQKYVFAFWKNGEIEKLS